MQTIQPNTFLLGVQKAGTSSLYNWLAQHPDIFAPSIAKDFHIHTHTGGERKKRYQRLQNFYKDYSGQKIILHAAVNYLYFPQAAQAIAQRYPDAKLIIVLRDPVKRAYSAYRYFYKHGIENLSFQQALEREQHTQLTIAQQYDLTYLAHGYYHHQISRYLQHYPRQQMCILLYEEMIKNKPQAIQQLLQFLQLPPFTPEYQTVNYTGQAKYRFINKFIFRNNPLTKTLKHLIPENLRHQLKTTLTERNITKAPSKPLPELLYHQLKTQFAQDIEKLEQLLNKPLHEIWAY